MWGDRFSVRYFAVVTLPVAVQLSQKWSCLGCSQCRFIAALDRSRIFQDVSFTLMSLQ